MHPFENRTHSAQSRQSLLRLSFSGMLCAGILLAAGCSSGGTPETPKSTPITSPVTSGNTPPTINGTAITTATVGSAYQFRPTASDVDGDTLVFSVVNLPSWATFNSSTGMLTGVPQAANIG